MNIENVIEVTKEIFKYTFQMVSDERIIASIIVLLGFILFVIYSRIKDKRDREKRFK